MKFDLDQALEAANQAMWQKIGRNLTDVEIIVFKGAWSREDYDAIAARNQYATSYISQDVAPKLWKNLSEALGEKVKKSNFKETLKRRWEKKFKLSSSSSKSQPQIIQSEVVETNSATEIYIERPPIETRCYETLMQPGALIRLKAPNLMGKTSLITQILLRLKQTDFNTVNLSFELADRTSHFTDLNKFLRWFCLNITKQLGMPNQLDEYWDVEDLGAKVSCTTYIEEYLLTEIDSPLFLCLDDVDLLFPHPEIYEDFFGLLRSWYEKARSRQLWQKLRLAIAHSTEVYIRLNINQSPFNVGLPIELPEFTPEQVREFAIKQKIPENILDSINQELISLVGGHPYLIELAFVKLKHNPDLTLAELVRMATTDAGIYSNHLREHWLSLQQNPQLAAAFKQVLTAKKSVQLDPIATYQLQSMGLVKLTGNQVEPRCNLYLWYFSDRLESL